MVVFLTRISNSCWLKVFILKPKQKEKFEILHPCDAISAAFSEIDDLDCLNLLKGKRVENAVPTGSLSLDLIIGGGLKPGLMGTLYGLEGTGKSSLAVLQAASGQNLNIPVVMYDPEAGSDPVYMRSLGLDLRRKIVIGKGKEKREVPGFFYSQPDTGEALYRHMLRVLRRLPIVDDGKPQIIFIIDSLAGMGSEEVDDAGEGGRIADEARMHSYFLKRVVPRLRRRGAILIGTNQMRQDIGSYGAPLKPAGGKALSYWPGYAIRLSTKKAEPDKIGVVTLPCIWRTTKNKAFPPFRTTDNRLMLGRGLDKSYDAFYFLKNLGYLDTKGGKHAILMPGHNTGHLSWKEFRYTVENPNFVAACKELLQDAQIWRRYFEQSQETTFVYDETYDYSDLSEEDPSQQLEEEATEYEEEKTKRRKQGKRPIGKSKTQDHADLDLDAETADPDDLEF